jgi:dienelactone hydrolase
MRPPGRHPGLYRRPYRVNEAAGTYDDTMRTKVPVVVCLLTALAVALSACSSSGSGGAAKSKATTAAAGPPYAVTQFTLTFVDTSRPTPRNGTYAGAPSRTLPTVITLPVGAPAPLPLVVFSTGIDGTGTNYEGLYRHWVQAGYAVAAPEFPLSKADAPGGSTIADFDNQPGDVRFVLDQLLDLSAAKTGKLAGKLDPNRIALAGKSLGAYTTLRTAFLVKDHESRENAVISLTGGGGAGTGADKMFTGVTEPLLLVHGNNDHTVPYAGSVSAFAAAEPPKFFVTLFGQDHNGAFDGEQNAAARVVVAVTLDFLDAYVRDVPGALDRLKRDATVAKVSSFQSQVFR